MKYYFGKIAPCLTLTSFSLLLRQHCETTTWFFMWLLIWSVEKKNLNWKLLISETSKLWNLHSKVYMVLYDALIVGQIFFSSKCYIYHRWDLPCISYKLWAFKTLYHICNVKETNLIYISQYRSSAWVDRLLISSTKVQISVVT